MAGIGFALKKLSGQDNLASRSLAGGHAILIASGPWIVIMAGLALLHYLGRTVVGKEELTTFSILVIYSFALSLVITAPISLEATLRVSALLFKRHFERVQAVYIAALFLTTALSVTFGALVVFYLLQLPLALGLATIICVVQVSHLWLAMAFVAAIKQYASVSSAFALGLSCSVVFGLIAATLGHGPGGMLVGFSMGLCVAFCILNFLIMRTFPGQLLPARAAIRALFFTRPLSIAFLLASISSAIAVWIDKFIIWHSHEGIAAADGLLYSPRYDSPMFIAYLSIVPVMSVFVVWLETSFFDSYRHYRDIVHSGGTLRQIEEQRRVVARETVEAVFAAFLVQLTVSGALAIAGPILAGIIGLPHDATAVLSLALVGAAFHFLFQACCGVILFVQYGRIYLTLQLLFLCLNGTITALMLANPDYLGMGYVFASVLSGVLAYAAMRKTLRSLNHLTFVINNPSVSV
jgi:uncharacterized membrane protein